MRLFTFAILFIFNLCFSQDPYFVEYGIEDGLPTSNIYSAFQDKDGYMWFCTDAGVLKYDGSKFENFTIDDGLADNDTFRIFNDSKNRMWFISLNGSISYYQNDTFFNTKNSSVLNKASKEKMIADINENNREGIHVLFKDGSVSIIKDNSVKKKVNKPVSSFALWFKNKQALIVNAKSIKNLNDEDVFLFDKNVTAKTFIRYVKESENNYIYSVKNKVYSFNKGISKFLFTIDNTSEIINLSIIEDNLFIGTRNGLFIKSRNGFKHCFNGEQISCSLKDKQGNLWITTLNNGIKFIPNENVFNQVFDSKNKTVFNLLDNLVASSSGLYEKNKAGTFKQIDKNKIFRFRKLNDSVFMFSNHLFVYENKNKLFKTPIRINDIIKSKDAYLIASPSYLSKLSYRDFDYYIKHPELFEKKLIENNIITRKRVRFMKLINNKIYLCTNIGLFYFDNNKITKVEPENHHLDNSDIVHIFYDEVEDKMFVSTLSSGVFILKNDKLISQIREKDGLNSNACNMVLKINTRQYLAATNNGINLIKVSEHSNLIEDVSGIIGLKKMRVNHMLIKQDTISLATNKGLISFHKNVLEVKNKTKPELLINSIKVNKKEFILLSNLESHQNNISVSYDGIFFKDYGNLNYEYKLNNNYWSNTKNNKIEFNNLPPDNYNLTIRAKSITGIYSTPKGIAFKVHPPFWKTILFKIICFTLLVLFLFYLIRRRLRQQKRKFDLERLTYKVKQEAIELEKLTVELEQKALRLQMNPHFIFNALNTIKGYYSSGNIPEANNYISRFSKLLRLILENDVHIISLEKEIEMLELYIKLNKLRYENNFEYKILVAPSLIIDNLGIPPLLLQPIVENAIIHGIAPNKVNGKLHISFKAQLNKLICIVTDNGIGIRVSKQKSTTSHKSKAIKITKERIELINDSKDPENFKMIDLQSPSGTQVIIKLPIIELW